MRFILIFTVFLSSCSIVEDPSQSGGLVSTTTNIVTGNYDERLQKRQEILSDAETKKQQLDQDNQQLEVEKMTLSQQIEVEKQQLNKLDSNILKFENKLMTEKSALKFSKNVRDKKLQQLSQLKQRNKELQQRVNVNNNKAAIEAIKAERDRLDMELNLLLEASE